EPHVRMITEMAVAMGKVVCTQDAEAACLRDENMLATPEAARMNAMIALGGIKSGVLDSGGAVAPDPGFGPGYEQGRLDDAAGYAALLIVREESDASRAFAAAGGFAVRLDALPDARGDLAGVIGAAPAILVRPDRYVFGTGDAAALVAAWNAYLASGVAKAESVAAV
ncbi:MAG: hypothetical protein Q8J92_09265, partial [Parvibaculum sp.]|nr:hypothetical protein [Parvibaculum sp.]